MGEGQPRRAAQYVRMSTEHQRCSIEGQTIANAAYALEHGYTVVATFQDAGISGISLARRDGLQALLACVVAGRADFEVVIVYDVSRWGRFQDPDESAHYEFLCREAGVRVEYAAEPFANDGSLTSTLVKHLKRAMAAEYSRELSAKVSAARRGLAAKGYWLGSTPCYGYRRQVVHPDGSLGRVLDHGERKALQGHRVILIRGPDPEVEVVRRIFREYAVHGLGTTEVARRLNAEGIPSNRGQAWSRNRVYRLLTDEKYGGVLVGGRYRQHLARLEAVPRKQWTRLPGACPALVERLLFDLVQANVRTVPRCSDEELLENLRRILARQGALSARIFVEEGRLGRSWYEKRFGSLANAYALAGYTPDKQQTAAFERHNRPPGRRRHALTLEELVARLQDLLRQTGRLTCSDIDNDPQLPSSTWCRDKFGSMERLWTALDYTPTDRPRLTRRLNLARPRPCLPDPHPSR